MKKIYGWGLLAAAALGVAIYIVATQEGTGGWLWLFAGCVLLSLIAVVMLATAVTKVRRAATVSSPTTTTPATPAAVRSGRWMAVAALAISLVSAVYGWWGVGGLEEEVSKKASAEEVAALRGEVAGKADGSRLTAVVDWADTATIAFNRLSAEMADTRAGAAAARREAGAMASKIKNLARSTDARLGVLEGQAAQFSAGAQAVMEAGAELNIRVASLERDVGHIYQHFSVQDSISAAHQRLILEADSTLTVLASLPSLRKAIAEYEKEQARRRAAAAAVRPDTTVAVPDTTAARAAGAVRSTIERNIRTATGAGK